MSRWANGAEGGFILARDNGLDCLQACAGCQPRGTEAAFIYHGIPVNMGEALPRVQFAQEVQIATRVNIPEMLLGNCGRLAPMQPPLPGR
jgi:hypothetical protein